MWAKKRCYMSECRGVVSVANRLIKMVLMHNYSACTLRCTSLDNQFGIASRMVYWNKDAIYALSSYKVLAWPIGVWPIENDIFYSKIRYFFAIVSEIWLMTTLLMNVYLACDNSSADPIDTYVVTSSAMLGIVKLTLLQIQRSTLSTSLYSAIQDWCSVKDARSREIMIQYARTARIISLSLFYSGFISLTFYMLRLLPFAHATTNGRTFVLPMSCLFESVSNLQYILITFYQVIQLLITYAGNCCTEGMFVGVTMHLCGQLELLMIDFQQIDRKHKRKGGSIFEEFVIRHRELLKLTENIDDSYSIIILTQIFTSAILICITGTDCMFLNITLHVCGQVEVLKAKFFEFDVTTPKVYERFIALIKRHSYLIRMATQLADTVNFVLLIQLFIISIQLCIMDFQFILALKVNNVVMAGKSVIVQSTFLLQLTLYSFIGDYLKSQMEEIGLSIYQNAWYNLPADLTKNLIFIIMRTQSPVMLQAGHFIVINLSTYMSILRVSISYLSVIRVMVEA